MSIPWIILEIILNIYDAAYIITIMTANQKLKYGINNRHLVVITLMLSALFSVFNFATDFSFVSIVIFQAFSLFILLLIEERLVTKIYWFALSWALMLTFEMSAVNFLTVFYKLSLQTFQYPGILRLSGIIIAKTLDTFLWFFIIRQKKNNLYPSIDLLLVNLLAGYSYLISLVISQYAVPSSPSIMSIVTHVVLTGASVFLSIFLLSQRNAQEKAVEESRKHILQSAYCKEIIQAYQSCRQFRYEMLDTMRSVWPDSGLKTPSQLQKYMEAFEQINEQMQYEYCSGYEVVDLVLYAKESEAFQMGIALHINGRIPSDCVVSPQEICVVLDYLLSQALKEVGCIEEMDVSKVVLLSFISEDNGLKLQVENPTNGQAHPLMLEAINYIPQKYEGYLETDNVDFYRTTTAYFAYAPSFYCQPFAKYSEQEVRT